jgi:hypothetical protein
MASVVLLVSGPAGALEFGVNIHHGEPPELNARRATVMKQRNLRTARMDLIYDWDQRSLRDQVVKIRANGGRVQVVLLTSHTWDHSCSPDIGAVERKAFAETLDSVESVKDLVHDFELLNETELRPDIVKEVPRNSAGLSMQPYEGKPCVAALAAALRGMSRAIRQVRERSGLPLRILFGQSGRDWGFLRFMQSQGVSWDVTTFHVYPHEWHRSLRDDPWWGPGGPFVQLAAFGKPVHVNEFNCGEIYDPSYENAAGGLVTERCLRSFARHLRDIVDQQVASIESVHVYELLDEPRKEPPENRFGLLDASERPKPHLFLLTAFTGGDLTEAERCEIVGRRLMTDAEIDARRLRQGLAASSQACRPVR